MAKGLENSKGEASKAIKDVHKSGTHVPEKDFSSKKKESKASGNVTVTFMPPHEHSDNKYEGSSKDWSDDYREAKRRGQSTEEYEDSARDRIADNAGQKRLDDKEGHEAIKHPEGYKKGVSAFSNRPKAAHGFGHSGSQRDGHLRRSGVAGAHQIGKKG